MMARFKNQCELAQAAYSGGENAGVIDDVERVMRLSLLRSERSWLLF